MAAAGPTAVEKLLNTTLDLAYKYTPAGGLNIPVDEGSLNPLLVTKVVLARSADIVDRFEFYTINGQKCIRLMFKPAKAPAEAHAEAKAPAPVLAPAVYKLAYRWDVDPDEDDEAEAEGNEQEDEDSEEGFTPVKPKPKPQPQPQQQQYFPPYENNRLIKTQLCKYYEQGHCLRRSIDCQYAHGKNDLRK